MLKNVTDSPLRYPIPEKPDYSLESTVLQSGRLPVAGIDEAGRGPLAGPVVAAAVILHEKAIPDGLDDSKRLSALKRDIAFDAILLKAVGVAISTVSAEAIDKSDIRLATLSAMRQAVGMLAVAPGFVLVDGRDIPDGLSCPAWAVVKGDQRSLSIAAASIVAKVLRDRMMARAGLTLPEYGFEKHKGYATVDHRKAAALHGSAFRMHRLSFAPFRSKDP